MGTAPAPSTPRQRASRRGAGWGRTGFQFQKWNSGLQHRDWALPWAQAPGEARPGHATATQALPPHPLHPDIRGAASRSPAQWTHPCNGGWAGTQGRAGVARHTKATWPRPGDTGDVPRSTATPPRPASSADPRAPSSYISGVVTSAWTLHGHQSWRANSWPSGRILTHFPRKTVNGDEIERMCSLVLVWKVRRFFNSLILISCCDTFLA